MPMSLINSKYVYVPYITVNTVANKMTTNQR